MDINKEVEDFNKELGKLLSKYHMQIIAVPQFVSAEKGGFKVEVQILVRKEDLTK